MKSFLVLSAAVVIGVPTAAWAAVMCPGRSPAAITSAAPESVGCQKTIAKQGEKFLKTKMKALSQCLVAQGTPKTCPDADGMAKIQNTVNGAAAKIAKKCAADAAQNGLSSSYAALTDDTAISSCMLSQHNASGTLAVLTLTGVLTENIPLLGDDDNAKRAACIKELSKSGTKYVEKALKNANKCLAKRMKDQVGGDLVPVCVGQYSGAFIPPTDPKTAQKQTDLIDKIEEKIGKKCGGLAAVAGGVASLFGCPGATTLQDLKECALCGGWDTVLDLLEQQYSETGIFVAHGPGAIQAAVSVATSGERLLIEPGNYQEEVTIGAGKHNLQLIGCGGANDNRPRIIPPVTQVSGRGIQATDVDGLLFQSLDFFDQTNDHIRVVRAEGVTFRDITGDGNRNTAYAVFPVLSNNVLVEGCKVRRQDDAPIYVGQSSTITVRFNDVREGVAGIEIENSSNAQVYGNYGTANTGGMLVFRDGSLPEDRSDCHDVHHNLFESNNEPNFGSGTVAAVPAGTGLLVISNHTSTFSYNVTRDNDTAGLVFTDEVVAGFGPPFSPLQELRDNYIFNNVMSGNGASPDLSNWPFPIGFDFVFLPSDSSGNCQNGNLFATSLGTNLLASTAPPHENIGTCVLPPPAFPTCPGTPISNP
jgi:parallel beta-helix repeat protein